MWFYPYSTIKYPLDNGQVGVVNKDQGVAKKCYQDSLRIEKTTMVSNPPPRPSAHNINFMDLEPR